MALKVVSQKKWVYTLYQSDGGYILSVVCGGAAIYESNIPLTAEEAVQALESNEALDHLAAMIRDNQKKYSPRSIHI